MIRLVTLLLTCAFGSTGCVYIPLFQARHSGPDFRPLVGPADSDKPIRPGVATWDSVEKLLGRENDKEGWHYVVYDHDYATIWLIPFFHHGDAAIPLYPYLSGTPTRLRLHFKNGVLERYEMEKFSTEILDGQPTIPL